MVAMVMVKRGAGLVVPDDLVVRGWRPLHPALAAVASGTDARVVAGGAGTPVQGGVDQVTVEDGAVGRGADRLSVQLQLLLGVPQLQGAGPLVGRRLLPVRQGDGGGQVDLVLQVGVGGLEAVESVPLQVRWHRQPVGGTRSVHLLLRKQGNN